MVCWYLQRCDINYTVLTSLQSMFIPVNDDDDGFSQHVWRIEKNKDGEISKKKLFGVRYVPLTDAPHEEIF